MGMTIDDVLAEYNAWKITISENVSPDCVDALDTAIDTMRKYQKIEEILADWNDGRFSDAVFCSRVKVVVEDGSTN